jgi:hypothetical protein
MKVIIHCILKNSPPIFLACIALSGALTSLVVSAGASLSCLWGCMAIPFIIWCSVWMLKTMSRIINHEISTSFYEYPEETTVV